MSNKENYIRKICDMVRAQCRAAYPALDLCFIIHRPGQLKDRMAIAQGEIRHHRAAKSVDVLLEKTPMMERSSLMGMGVKTGPAFFGLVQRDHFLALININTEDITDIRQARHLAYHLAWHAIDLMQHRNRSGAREKYQDGPMVPQRTAAAMAGTNLKADIFAVMMNYLQGNKKALSELAHSRSVQSVTPYRQHRVEDYPYILIAEAVQYAVMDLEKRGSVPRGQIVKQSHALAMEIGGPFDDTQLQQWHSFAAPAQNMAWAGHAPEEILGAAVNTSENPYIRTTGFLVAQFSEITPLSASTMMTRYNSFTSFERNERLHKERMEDIFQAALAKGLREQSGQPFTDAAHKQNEDLTHGHILGWCAGALQEAGESFDTTVSMDKDRATELARTRFNDTKEETGWHKLVELGDKIIAQKRDGYATTLPHIASLCEGNHAYGALARSLEYTMQDPAYVRRLEAAQEFHRAPGAAPSAQPKMAAPAPAPRDFAPVQPAPVVAPTLGGASSQMVRAKFLARQKRLAEQQARGESQ